MTKCNRKKQLLGKSIRNVRMRRNITQRALAKATDGVSESALRSYELGERSPKQDALAEFTQDGAKTYLQRLKSVWMESPFWNGVRRAMEEKPQ